MKKILAWLYSHVLYIAAAIISIIVCLSISLTVLLCSQPGKIIAYNVPNNAGLKLSTITNHLESKGFEKSEKLSSFTKKNYIISTKVGDFEAEYDYMITIVPYEGDDVTQVNIQHVLIGGDLPSGEKVEIGDWVIYKWSPMTIVNTEVIKTLDQIDAFLP